MITLQFEKRTKENSLDKVRAAGFIPAVFYGRKEASTPISVNRSEFLKVWKKAGETSIISLKSGAEEHEALIKDMDLDPITDEFRHVDFYVVEKGKKLEISVPLTFVGVSAAVKELGGILVKALHELKIEALPKDLPQSLEVDITPLKTFDSKILAQEIKLPAGVELKENAEEVVAAVAQPVEEKEEVAAPVDFSAIEVEKKGKKEEEGAEGEAAPAEKK